MHFLSIKLRTFCKALGYDKMLVPKDPTPASDGKYAPIKQIDCLDAKLPYEEYCDFTFSSDEPCNERATVVCLYS